MQHVQSLVQCLRSTTQTHHSSAVQSVVCMALYTNLLHQVVNLSTYAQNKARARRHWHVTAAGHPVDSWFCSCSALGSLELNTVFAMGQSLHQNQVAHAIMARYAPSSDLLAMLSKGAPLNSAPEASGSRHFINKLSTALNNRN